MWPHLWIFKSRDWNHGVDKTDLFTNLRKRKKNVQRRVVARLPVYVVAVKNGGIYRAIWAFEGEFMESGLAAPTVWLTATWVAWLIQGQLHAAVQQQTCPPPRKPVWNRTPTCKLYYHIYDSKANISMINFKSRHNAMQKVACGGENDIICESFYGYKARKMFIIKKPSSSLKIVW